MPGIALRDMYNVKDILPNNRYVLLFGAIPGIGFNNNTKNLTYKCSQLSFPGSNIETIVVPLYGHERVFRGRKTSSHSLALTFYEDKNMGTYLTFRGWMNAVSDTETGNSYGSGGIGDDVASDLLNTTISNLVDNVNGIPLIGGVAGDLANSALRNAAGVSGRVTEYKSDFQISIINSQGHAALIATVRNAFPQEINSIELDGGGTAPALVQVTMAYEYIAVRSGFSDTDIYTLMTSLDQNSIDDVLSRAGMNELDNLIGAASGIGGAIINNVI